MKKSVYFSIISVLVIIFLGCAFYLGSYFWNSKKQADRYDELSTLTSIETTAPASTAAAETPSTAAETTAATEPTENPYLGNGEILPPYRTIHEGNSDVVGWIRMEGTNIDYPVMQTGVDNASYYLYKNYDKEPSAQGSIYAWEKCDVFTPSDNITLFGHNMKDGSMFAALGKLYDKSEWEQHNLITFDTIYEYHVYKVFGVFITSANYGEGFAYHRVTNAANAEEFNSFISTIKSLSFYDTGITPIYGDKILCLSTCEYTLDNGRFVVAAVRIS